MRVCTCVPVCLSVCVSTPLCPPAWQGFVGAAGTPPRERGSGASPHPRCRGSPGPRAAAPPHGPRCPPLPPRCPPLPAVAPAPLRETQQREAGARGAGTPLTFGSARRARPAVRPGRFTSTERASVNTVSFSPRSGLSPWLEQTPTPTNGENSAHRRRPRAQTHGRPVSPTQQRPPPKL